MPQDTLGNSMVDLDSAVALIRGAGGKAILAHWYFHEDKVSRESLETIVANGRIDGIETAVFNVQNGVADYTASILYLRSLAIRYNLPQVMGIDGHYKNDFEIYKGSGEAEHSVGQTQALINRFQPNLTESNY